MNRRPQIFLSYAHEDRAAVEKVYHRLSKEGFKPWMDVKDIQAGARWDHHIQEALHNSDFVLIFLSNHSINRRGYIQKEIKSALSLLSMMPSEEIFLIPIRLEECEVPESLVHIQHLDLFKENAWEQLLKVLEYGLKKYGIERHKEEIDSLKESILEEEKQEGEKPYIFVAMPFSKEMEDVYFYGIQRAADATNFQCKRIDKESFTGDILLKIKESIETSSATIADLSGANPNVYLELGYAWGKSIPTILIAKDIKELCFDVKGQRCLQYDSIRSLEEVLTSELEKLRSQKII